MIDWLAGGDRAVVAGGAGPRRPLEAAPDVAGITVHGDVCTDQREASGKVIERAPRGLLRRQPGLPCEAKHGGDARERDQEIAIYRHSRLAPRN